MTHYESLIAKIGQVRRRWRSQILVRGIAILLACVVAVLVFTIWGADFFGFNPAAIWLARFLAAAVTLFAAWRFLYLPMRRRVSDVTVAQYIEETYPDLEDRLVTAVEYGDKEKPDTGIIELLIRDALKKTARVDLSAFVNRRRVTSFGVLGIGAVVLLFALLSWGPAFFPYGFSSLYAPWTLSSLGSVMAIRVSPGNIDVLKGSDQLIDAQLVGFDSPDVRLCSRLSESDPWTTLGMEPDPRGSSFRYLLVDLQDSQTYYVESKGVRSPVYSLNVVEQARVENIDLTYNFPAYTGMSPQTVYDEGDVSALKGTKMDLRIGLNIPLQSARLEFNDRSTIDLSPSGNGDFSGSFVLDNQRSYSVQVSESGSGSYTASRDYEIEVIEDAAPSVTVTKPMRDLRATSLEEVFSEVKAEDDIGTGKVDLLFSVNGSPEEAVNLYQGRPPEPSVTASHVFFLEEFGLEPGDLISYYAKAWDSNNITGPESSTSDIYFIQIRPFQQNYVQNQQQGAAGAGEQGGQEGESQEALSRQQKEIISATFKLVRDGDQMESKEYEDSLKSLALVQVRLQSQAQGLADRLQRRNAAQAGADFGKLEEYLNNAISEMGKAALDLGEQKPDRALPPEQKSLQQLMRAESMFREIQVSFSAQASGSGSGSQASAEDLADLFELELNKLKNQYETVQNTERQQQDQKVDEALQRLKKLAERQQQLNQNNRLRAQQRGTSSSSAGSGGNSQQQLMEQAEELRRQLQKLSRERSSRQLDEASNRIRKAIDEMQKALANSQNGSTAETEAQRERALQQLKEAIRNIARGQQEGLEEGLNQIAGESRNLVKQQERIQEELDRLSETMPPPDSLAEAVERSQGIVSRKEQLAEQLNNLEDRVRDLSRQARKSQKPTSDKLAEAAGTIRDRRLSDRIEEGSLLIQNGFYESQQRRENYILEGLEEVQRQLEAAKGSIGDSEESRIEEAADRARQLSEGLESMQRRMSEVQSAQNDRSNPRQTTQPGQRQSRDGSRDAQGQQSRSEGNKPSENGRSLASSKPGVPDPGSDRMELSQNASGPPSGTGQYRDNLARQWNREVQERLADAGGLQNFMNTGSSQMDSLEKVIDALKQSMVYPDTGAQAQAEYLKSAIELMRQIEFDLSRDLRRLKQVEEYFTAGDNEAPESYRKLVEEYYKSIAGSK